MENGFRFASYRFTLQASEQLNLPEYKGSALRGGFGHAFKKVTCALKNKECPACLLRDKCAYSYIFETPPPLDSRMMRKYPAAPHPFVLCPPLEDDRIYEPGERLRLNLVLIGRAIEYLPYFVYTFEELGGMGLGKGRGKFILREVEAIPPQVNAKPIYSGEERILRGPGKVTIINEFRPIQQSPGSLQLIFLTPVRLKSEGSLASGLEFHVLLRNLLRRISLLAYFHCGMELDLDYRKLIEQAHQVRVKAGNLRWFDWERYSARQDERMKLGGLVGKIVFDGDLAPFWPFLLLGEAVHVGKGTSFGLGKYEILNRKDLSSPL